jgi:hypothetical protein
MPFISAATTPEQRRDLALTMVKAISNFYKRQRPRLADVTIVVINRKEGKKQMKRNNINHRARINSKDSGMFGGKRISQVIQQRIGTFVWHGY